MQIDSSYIKDLQIFIAVVNANGVSNAQAILNKDASAISRSLNALEVRLGLTLCERGRQGFKLTKDGRIIVEQAHLLFNAFRTFKNNVEASCGLSANSLSIGVIDNVITDIHCPLHKVLHRINNEFCLDLNLSIEIKSPYALEKLLLNKEIDIALGIFESCHNRLHYSSLYTEVDFLYCSSQHSITQSLHESHEILIDTLKNQDFCARNFLNEADIKCLGFQVLGKTTYTSNLEALAFLILSGAYIGFLPQHFAQRFVDEGKLVAVLPEHIKRLSTIKLVHRKGEEMTRSVLSKALQFFMDNQKI